METDIISHFNVLDGDFTASVLVKHFVGLMYHITASLIKITSDSTNELIERELAILVSVKVLHDLVDFQLRKV